MTARPAGARATTAGELGPARPSPLISRDLSTFCSYQLARLLELKARKQQPAAVFFTGIAKQAHGTQHYSARASQSLMPFRLGFSGGARNRFFAPLFTELIEDARIEIVACVAPRIRVSLCR